MRRSFPSRERRMNKCQELMQRAWDLLDVLHVASVKVKEADKLTVAMVNLERALDNLI